MEHLELATDSLRLLIAPGVGGSIARFDWVTPSTMVPILRGCAGPLQSPLDSACFPLVPFCNRIRDGRFVFRGREVVLSPNMKGDPSAIHGQGWLSRWTVERAHSRKVQLLFDHAAGEWPWRYQARQAFTLDSTGLAITLSCRNLSNDPMPCGLGLHPYFPCTAETRLATRVSHVWTIDEQILPVERIAAAGRYDLSGAPICSRGLDNGYDGWSGQADIETSGAPFALVLSSPATEYFQLYSPASGGLFVAEPVSHANNALGTNEEQWPSLGMRVLEPGEEIALGMRLEVRNTAH